MRITLIILSLFVVSGCSNLNAFGTHTPQEVREEDPYESTAKERVGRDQNLGGGGIQSESLNP